MKRIILFIISSLLIPGAMVAQGVTSIVIGTNPTTPNGPVFLVDGTVFGSTQVFLWPVGSKHNVEFPFSLDYNGNQLPYQSSANDNIRFSFGGWVASTGTFPGSGNAAITITADPSLTSLFASVGETFQVNINFSVDAANAGCSGAPGNPPPTAASGVMYFDGTCYGSSATFYTGAGSHTLNAFPYPGSVFYGYTANGFVNTPLYTLNIVGPMTITPLFSQAKRVIFMTNPPGLKVLVDGSTVTTPPSPASTYDGDCTPDDTRIPPAAPAGFPALCTGEFDFLPGSTHTVGAPSPQLINQQGYWVFEQYNNGLTQNSSYVAPQNVDVWDTLTAGFVPGVTVSFYTTPLGLKLMIDGRDNWPGYTFIWGQGETHQVNAESPQTDAKGRVWSFNTWSDGGTQAHSLAVPTNTTGLILNASFSEFDQVTLTSNPPGLTFTVDGSTCTTPCVVNKAAGATSQVSAPSSVPNAPGWRYDFTSWSDGSTAASRTVTFSQSTLTLSANYQTSYQLTTAVNPAKGGTFQFSPTSPDGYYASGTQVTVTAVPAAGYKFVKWTGDVTGTVNPDSLQVIAPQSFVANFLSVPYIPPAGIQSAAGPTADGSVAAGSLISIYGQSLAPALQVGASNPLQQAIGGTTVTVGQYILPLVFVSPGLINAQVPWEIQPGTYTLVVHNTGQDDVPAQLTVSRESPGVFTQPNAQQQPLVLALHQDGTPVTFDSPAVHGEQITIYGTGFGPYDQPAVDGFPSAAGTTVNLLDSLMLNCDIGPVQPDWAGAATGMVGVAAVQLTIGNAMPVGTVMNLTISVNGRDSLPLVLPLQ